MIIDEKQVSRQVLTNLSIYQTFQIGCSGKIIFDSSVFQPTAILAAV